jgi:hypothetical protein
VSTGARLCCSASTPAPIFCSRSLSDRLRGVGSAEEGASASGSPALVGHGSALTDSVSARITSQRRLPSDRGRADVELGAVGQHQLVALPDVVAPADVIR